MRRQERERRRATRKKEKRQMEIDYSNQQRREETFSQWGISEPGAKPMASAGFIFSGRQIVLLYHILHFLKLFTRELLFDYRSLGNEIKQRIIWVSIVVKTSMFGVD